MAEVPALRRSIGILRHLGSSLLPVSAGALARTLSIPRSSLYDLLSVLEEFDMVRRSENGYLLGSGVGELDAAHSRHDSLRRIVQPTAAEAAEAAGGSVCVSVLRGGEAHCLLRETATRLPCTGVQCETRKPAYLTAAGRAILSRLEWREVAVIYSSEPVFAQSAGQELPSLREFNAELAEVRSRGCALEHPSMGSAVLTVAAPIVDAAGGPIAAFGVSVSPEGIGADREREVSALAIEAAEGVSAHLR